MLPPATCWPYLAASSGSFSIRTFFQSTSSSSAMTMGSIVLMPWPISGFFDMMVTMPSGAMRMKALSVVGAAVEAASAARDKGGRVACSESAPRAAALAFKKLRREDEKEDVALAVELRARFGIEIIMIFLLN